MTVLFHQSQQTPQEGNDPHPEFSVLHFLFHKCDSADIIILSYAFKMRQDYLSSSYLDQKYLPSERSERGRYELIQVTCAEIILSHFECIWWYFSHTFHYLTDEISWKYEKTCQSGTWMLVPLICVRLTFSPRRFTRITLAMCGALRFQRRWRSWVRLSISHMWGSEVVITYMIRVRCVLRGPLYHMTIQPKGVRIYP